jgi:hypothetical protein
MNWSHTATGVVSGAVGLICLVAAFLMYTVGRGRLPRLIVVLTLTGVAGLGGAVKDWLRQGVGWVDSLVGHVAGRFTGTVVIGLVGIVAVVYLVVGLVEKRADRLTLVAAAVAVLAVSSIPGPAGNFTSGTLSALTGAVGKGVGAMFGLG